MRARVKVKLKVKLRFSASSAGIAEVAKRLSSPRSVVMTLKWLDPTGYRGHST